MRRSRCSADSRALVRCTDERGSASLEFLTIGFLLLVPLVYLVLAVSAIQSGALAVEGAARHAARVAVDAADRLEADAAAERAVSVALSDYGIDADAASITLSCDPVCLQPGSRLHVQVTASVRLPLVPDVLVLDRLAEVAVEASATQTVSRFSGGGS